MTINALNIIPVKTASCPEMGTYAKKAKATVSWDKKKVGDIIEFDFNKNGTPDHTGIIEKVNKDGSITTIEGNTSLTSNDNGGSVMRRTRYKSQIAYFVRPKYDDKVTAKMIIATAVAQIGITEKPRNSNKVKYNTWFYGKEVSGSRYPWCMTFVQWLFAHAMVPATKPVNRYTGVLPTPTLEINSKGAEVEKLQKFLTWYGISTNADGDFGMNTRISVLRFQLTEGLTVDGVFGKKSLAAAVKYTTIEETTLKPPVVQPEPQVEKKNECIDVSYWQGNISLDNWKKIKKSCDYAVCRATYTGLGSFSLGTDSTFKNNVKRAKEAGFSVGAYHFSQAKTVEEAKKEAKYFCDVLDKVDKIDFWAVCDYETNAKGRLNGKTVSTKASDIANAFCDVVKDRGYNACIYANYTMLTKYLKNPKYPVWLAQYNNTMSYKKDVVMWQYTSSGKVSGIEAKNTNNKSALVDLSHVYKVPETKPEPVPEPVPELKGYTGKFPEPNTNPKLINSLSFRLCYPYGTPEKKYTYKDGSPKKAYTEAIAKAYPNHDKWTSKKQKAGACCDTYVGSILGCIGIEVPHHLKDQLLKMPKMSDKLKINGHSKASEFKMGDIVQRGRTDMSGHTWAICELINGQKYIANAHYKKLNGCYAVMDAKPATISVNKWAYYECYTVLGAYRTDYRKGDYGYDVLYTQKFLNWYGIKVTEDGDFGKNTEAAVKVFQEAMGLSITGRVDEKTIEMMKKVKK